jgi:hypothetical protein
MKPMSIGRLRLLTSLALLLLAPPSPGAERASAGTVPFIFDDNRIFAEVAFVRPDGTLRKALAFVDLGTPAPVIGEGLRQELGVDRNEPLRLRIGRLDIPLDASTVETDTGSSFTGRHGKATAPVEAILPGSVMKNYQVIFDYAKRTLTLARPGTLAPEGAAVPCRVNGKTGLISVAAEIEGRTYEMTVDSGSAYSWVRDSVARQWVVAHPAWKRGVGAVGEANMQTRPGTAEASATILRIPEIGLGSLRLTQIGMLGVVSEAPPFPPAPGEPIVQGDLFDWYSRKAPGPVIGWLGGNVLKGFRLTIDFPRQMTYWQRQRDVDPHDLDQIGVTLEKRRNGYFIAGVAEKDGIPTVDGIRAGDRLVQVDAFRLEGATRGAVFSALHGRPDSVHMLIVERDGKRMMVPAKVSAF